ncbi:4'-phosphopantetheinyl transferase family protein [Citricoccus nitrophenolicus]|uniref:4'-phosphopantetheinyl transferase family protein n=1 Tax=Citricoccus nitrophenolicus TaxID=863575 RepID=UPI0031F04E8F
MTVDVWWSTLASARHGLLPILSPLERSRVAALEREADRGRSMLGAALLRVAVADHLGVPPAAVEVDRTCDDCGAPHGAPRIIGPLTQRAHPAVSVSHSGVLVVVAVGDVGPVGIDVQRLADLPDPADGSAWVQRETAVKAGRDEGPVRGLQAPLPGYAAALALPETAGPVRVRTWDSASSPGSTPGSTPGPAP